MVTSTSEETPPAPRELSRAGQVRAEADPVSALDILAVFITGRMLFLWLGLGLAVLFPLLVSQGRDTYQAVTSIMPTVPPQGSQGLGGIAASVLAGSGTGPSMYTYMVRSEAVLRRVIHTPLAIQASSSGKPVTLFDKYGGSGSSAEREMRALKAASNAITATSDASGLVHITYTASEQAIPSAALSALVDVLNAMSLEVRQTQTVTEGTFIKARLAEQAAELRKSEDALEAFIRSNRQYQSDPQLLFEHDRLARTLQLAQNDYVTLAEGYQQIRIDASRDTPTLSVIEPPLVPYAPDRKPYLLATVAGLFSGFAFAAIALLLGEFRLRARDRWPNAYQRLVLAVHDVRRDLVAIKNVLVSRSKRPGKPA
jgi:uncharacterized protein involved in exopolysaccharide biosynthesis